MLQASAYGRRLVSGGTLLMFVAASVALLAIASYKPKPATNSSRVAVLASVGLTDDDGGQGLFDVEGLVPGRPVSRCITVSYAGEATTGTVFVSATEITGPLAGNLRIKVEQGTGGALVDCTGFTGIGVVYDGLLGGLEDADPAAPRTSTGWSPTASDSRRFRITATVQDVAAAQGRTSTATFRWFLFGSPAPAPTTPGPTTPAPTTPGPTTPAPTTPGPTTPAPTTPAPTTPAPTTPAPTTPAPTTPAPTTSAPTTRASTTPTPTTPAPTTPALTTPGPTTPAPSAPAPTTPAPQPAATTGPPVLDAGLDTSVITPTTATATRMTDAPAPAATASHRAANSGMDANRSGGNGNSGEQDEAGAAKTPAAAGKPIARKIQEALAEFGRNVTEVAVRSTTHSALPLTGAAVLLAFLLLQNRLDRLDPRLSSGRAEEPHLVFRDPRDPDDPPAATTAGTHHPTAPPEEDA